MWLDMIWPMNLIFTDTQKGVECCIYKFWFILRMKMIELRHSDIASRLRMLEWVFLQSFNLIGHDLTNESDFHCRSKGQHYMRNNFLISLEDEDDRIKTFWHRQSTQHARMSISAKFQSDWKWSDQWIWFSLTVRKVWNVAYTSFDFFWGWRWSN